MCVAATVIDQKMASQWVKVEQFLQQPQQERELTLSLCTINSHESELDDARKAQVVMFHIRRYHNLICKTFFFGKLRTK